ncbi:hypothetical protein PAHAL_8G153300 [Panicum hallii]|uniref:No apical meristem-associated C-terminal domain-containing protein n=1 Tax=Panicum hallii TaxID=206008 RepID=A0A2S3IEY3_9POAL|nr:hypothetical protein PAHAL_8G153300 [Panicum hallii]
MEGGDGYFTNLLNDGQYDAGFEDYGTIPIESQQSPPENEINLTSKAPQKQKGKNFSVDEDRLLVSAWLNVSTDPTQGTNQTKDTFWRRIHRYYDSNRGPLPDRNQNSLLHCWSSINDAINNRNQSGMTIHDRVEEAEKLFKSLDTHNKSFQFRHSAAKNSHRKQKEAKNTSPGLVDPTTPDGNQDAPAETSPPQTDLPRRIIGKKMAKEMRRGGMDAYSDALDTLWAKKREADAEKELKRDDRFAKLEQKKLAIEEQKYTNEQKRLEQEKERLDNEANNLYLKRIAEEQRIMSMDLSAMSDMQRQYYMCLQAEIVARRMN